eukprot:1884000-Amphidinium_carterae.1
MNDIVANDSCMIDQLGKGNFPSLIVMHCILKETTLGFKLCGKGIEHSVSLPSLVDSDQTLFSPLEKLNTLQCTFVQPTVLTKPSPTGLLVELLLSN